MKNDDVCVCAGTADRHGTVVEVTMSSQIEKLNGNTYSHEGTIYKASNFVHNGMTAKGIVIMYNGKRYHDKTIRTKYKGKLKPFAIEIKNALETGLAEYVKTLGKHIYLYELRK